MCVVCDKFTWGFPPSSVQFHNYIPIVIICITSCSSVKLIYHYGQLTAWCYWLYGNVYMDVYGGIKQLFFLHVIFC